MAIEPGSLTMQQEKLVLLHVSGMTMAAAGRGAGYACTQSSHRAFANPNVKKAVEFYRNEMREEVDFTVKTAHMMYMDSFASSANATEMKNTTDSLVKLHGLVKPESQSIEINVNNTKQLERMSDEDLLKIAGQSGSYLEPSAE
jgi:phage terminase small subunit